MLKLLYYTPFLYITALRACLEIITLLNAQAVDFENVVE